MPFLAALLATGAAVVTDLPHRKPPSRAASWPVTTPGGTYDPAATVLLEGPQVAKDLKRLLEREHNADSGVSSTTGQEARDKLGRAFRPAGEAQRVLDR